MTRIMVASLMLLGSEGLSPQPPPVAQRMLNAVLQSPLYNLLLVPQARRTMVKTAEENGIPWQEALEWIQSTGDWSDTTLRTWAPLDFEYPDYYTQQFHAYEQGNLCFKAAHEQELAGKAVGQRNYPGNGPGAAGEEAFRNAFSDALFDELGAGRSLLGGDGEGGVPPRQKLIIDCGCGSGTSTRRLARRFKGRDFAFRGVDLSPHFLAVAQFLQQTAPRDAPRERQQGRESEAGALLGVGADGLWRDPSPSVGNNWVEDIVGDPRIEFVHGDVAPPPPSPQSEQTRRVDGHHRRPFPDGCASAVNVDLVIHELPPHATKQLLAEARRLLRPEDGELWICEMDFSTPGYQKLRGNPLLFSLIRATEPFLDEYADWQASGGLVEALQEAGFRDIRIAAATGRHFALMAKVGPDHAAPVVDDRRFDPETGRYVKEDTHLKTWESKKK